MLRLAQLGRRITAAEGARYAAIIALVTVLGGGAAFADAEHGASTWDGVWWALTTMTTVGYGDITPNTTIGRVIALPIMLVGIGVAAVLTAAIAQRFLSNTGPDGAAHAHAHPTERPVSGTAPDPRQNRHDIRSGGKKGEHAHHGTYRRPRCALTVIS